jgi:hypothetical protein
MVASLNFSQLAGFFFFKLSNWGTRDATMSTRTPLISSTNITSVRLQSIRVHYILVSRNFPPKQILIPEHVTAAGGMKSGFLRRHKKFGVICVALQPTSLYKNSQNNQNNHDSKQPR